MTAETTTKTRPTYRVYIVSKGTEEKSNWQEVGAAWKHKDGKGLTLQLSALPIGDAQVVLREPKAPQIRRSLSGGQTGAARWAAPSACS